MIFTIFSIVLSIIGVIGMTLHPYPLTEWITLEDGRKVIYLPDTNTPLEILKAQCNAVTKQKRKSKIFIAITLIGILLQIGSTF